MKNLTTGECAKFCQVAGRTIHKWMDSGLLKGFRVPGSTHRRVPHENLVLFMKEHGLPIPEELQIIKFVVPTPTISKRENKVILHFDSSDEANTEFDRLLALYGELSKLCEQSS